MISDRISYDIPPQIKILNIVIPFLMLFQQFCLIEALHAALIARHPPKCDVINYVKLFPTYTVANFDVIHSNVALQKQVH